MSYIDTALSGCGVFLCCVVFEFCVGFWLNKESHFSHALAAIETARSAYYGGDDVQSAVHYQRLGEQSLCLDARYSAFYTARCQIDECIDLMY